MTQEYYSEKVDHCAEKLKKSLLSIPLDPTLKDTIGLLPILIIGSRQSGTSAFFQTLLASLGTKIDHSVTPQY